MSGIGVCKGKDSKDSENAADSGVYYEPLNSDQKVLKR
jgi:hypothetical protein